MDVRIGEYVIKHPIVDIAEGRTALGTEALAGFVMTISPSGGWVTLEQQPEQPPLDDSPSPIVPVIGPVR
jgi:hypothetical protein